MKSDRSTLITIITLLVATSLVLASCTPTPTTAPTRMPTRLPTPIPLPRLSLVPGEFYFRLDDQPAMIFSRNFLGPILSRTGADLITTLELAHQAGTRLIRVHLTGWWGTPSMNNDGTVNETWAQNWDWFFSQAEVYGIYVLPVFGVCADWNDAGWEYNPLNQANGGYLTDPTELLSSAETSWDPS